MTVDEGRREGRVLPLQSCNLKEELWQGAEQRLARRCMACIAFASGRWEVVALVASQGASLPTTIFTRAFFMRLPFILDPTPRLLKYVSSFCRGEQGTDAASRFKCLAPPMC